MTVRDFVIRLLLDRTQARQGIADTRAELREVGAASTRAADRARDALDDAAQAGQHVGRKVAEGAEDARTALDGTAQAGRQAGHEVAAGAAGARGALDDVAQVGRQAGREVADGAEDAASALGEEGEEGRKAGDKIAAGAADATSKTKTLKDSIKEVIAAAGGIAAIYAYITNTASLDRTAESLGLSVERLQMWQGAAQAAGGDAEEIAERFRDLNDYITDATKFDSGPLKDIAKEIGVSLTDATGKARNAEDVMLDLADAFQRVGEQEAVGYGMQLSFDPATIGMLQQGGAGLEALLNRQREPGILTKRDTEAATRARQSFVDAIKAATYIVGTTLTPVLEWLSGWLSGAARWAVKNRDFLRQLFVVAAVAITTVMLPALLKMAAAGLAAIAPFLPLIALVAALSLAINDLSAFIDGGNSKFEEFLNWLGLNSEQIETIRSLLKPLAGILGDVLDLVKSFFSQDSEGVTAAFQRITDKISNLKKIFSSMLDAIKKKLLSVLPPWALEILGADNEGNNEAQEPGADAGETPYTATEGGMQAVAMQGAAMSGAPGVSNQDNRKTVTATTTVQNLTINTQAKDGKEVAESFGTELGNVMQQEYALW